MKDKLGFFIAVAVHTRQTLWYKCNMKRVRVTTVAVGKP